MFCSHCGSANVQSLGVRFYGNKKVKKYKCNICATEFVSDDDKSQTETISKHNVVVTSATAGFTVNTQFFQTLLHFCNITNSKLMILPVNNGKEYNIEDYPEVLRPFMVDRKVVINSKTAIMGNIKLGTNLESPIQGLDMLSKGNNIVFGHPQLQLRTLPRKSEKYPSIITTTGSVSIPKYPQNKTAHKAQFNHSYSAIFIDGNNEHIIRNLNFDGNGFYDLDTYYTSDDVLLEQAVEAIVLGDEHVMFMDPTVRELTFGKGGLVDKLKPKYLVRHDVLDNYSITHHHNKDPVKTYFKFINGSNSLEQELEKTLDFIISTTPPKTTSIIVSSNHSDHLARWLREVDIKHDPQNMKLYHRLMWLLLNEIDESGVISDPFYLWAKSKNDLNNIRFLGQTETFLIHDIDVSNHGNHGVNGAKGTINSFKDVPLKTIIGHSHSPGIEKGAYQVGTSSVFNLEYNKGLSTWHHCHCLIHKNGKRQLVFMVD